VVIAIGEDEPSRRILHSLLYFLLSSSICLSIASERAFSARSVADAQLPIVELRKRGREEMGERKRGGGRKRRGTRGQRE
jgi:hypothetical protein